MSAAARRSRTHRRRTVSALLAALVPLLALVGLAGPTSAAPPAAPASRATPTPSPTPSDDDRLPVRVQITAVDPAVLRPGEDLVVRARLTNTGDEEVATPRAHLRLERIRPGSREDLRGWLDEPDSSPRAGRRTVSVEAEEPLAPGGSVDVEMTLPPSAVNLLDRPDTWGARGLAVEATVAGRRVGLARSFLLWATDGGEVAQARVSVLAPVAGAAPVPLDADVQPPGTSLAEDVRPGGRLDAVLRIAQADHDVALLVDPAVLHEARARTDATATWADAVGAVAVGRDVAALPWSDPDLAALAHADDDELLTAAVDTSASAVSAVLDDGRPLAARTDVMWVPGPDVDQATVDLAARHGASVVVLPPDDGDDADPADARAPLTTATGTVVSLTPDATLTTLLADPASLDPDATTASTVQRVLAELSVIARSSESGLQHVLVALPRDAEPDAALVTDVLEAVRSAPWSRTAPLTSLLGARDADDTREPLPDVVTHPDELPVAAVQRLAEARRGLVAFAAATEEPATLLTGADGTALAPVATAWRGDPDTRRQLVDLAVEELEAGRTGLALAPTSTQRLISADNTVRFSVRNDLPTSAQVRVETTPRKACLRAGRSEPVVVEANSEQTVPVAVTAIANCDVVVEALLTTTDGVPLAKPVTFVVRASPTIESVGTAIVGVLLAVGLVLGIVRTVRRGQSARRGARRVDDEAGTRPLPVLGGVTKDGDT